MEEGKRKKRKEKKEKRKEEAIERDKKANLINKKWGF